MERKLITIDEFKNEYKKFLMEYRHYSENEADFSISDFDDPWSYELCEYEFENNETIDEIEYEVYSCKIDFVKHFGSMYRMMGGTGDKEFDRALKKMDTPFEFTFYVDMTNHNGTFGAYVKARKLFEID